MARFSPWQITEEELQHHTRQMSGFCVKCGRWTSRDSVPRQYACPSCGCLELGGVSSYVDKGDIEIVEFDLLEECLRPIPTYSTSSES